MEKKRSQDQEYSKKGKIASQEEVVHAPQHEFAASPLLYLFQRKYTSEEGNVLTVNVEDRSEPLDTEPLEPLDSRRSAGVLK